MERIGGSVQRHDGPTKLAPGHGDAPPTEADGASGDRSIPIGLPQAEQTAKAWIDHVLLFLMPAVPVAVQVSAELG